MRKILRNLSTAETRSFWEKAEESAAEVKFWPAWKRAGINVSEVREQPREEAVAPQSIRTSNAAKK